MQANKRIGESCTCTCDVPAPISSPINDQLPAPAAVVRAWGRRVICWNNVLLLLSHLQFRRQQLSSRLGFSFTVVLAACLRSWFLQVSFLFLTCLLDIKPALEPEHLITPYIATRVSLLASKI
ncbi:hypothetical protein CONLIGDRAFT_250947 [Coniochaeta ligniaria NRRL 30616]|uniref:Uncharacterized protein n=1 Tax=Coniochaeta ligniaria NRRL 30616 TaxID=1408157 RepID=A0A1J7JWA3_9PEZI|nr:hypothetical protein CONLIGDRAFT_250947 [Coniochaeta ligniaria NRRL 30616]